VRALICTLGPPELWSDAVCEQRHQAMKLASGNTNRGNAASWARTIMADLHLRTALALAFREGRWGYEFEHPLGESLVAFLSSPSPFVGGLVHESKAYARGVDTVLRDERESAVVPRPVNPALPSPPAGSVATLPCWCCEDWQHETALVEERRPVYSAGQQPKIAFSYSWGGSPAQPLPRYEAVRTGDVLHPSRFGLLRRAFAAAYPLAPVPVAASAFTVYSAIKLPGELTLRVGDWALVDRHQLLLYSQLVGDASDEVADSAAATLDRNVAVPEDYDFWPNRFAALRVRHIVSVNVGGVECPLIDPVYYEFRMTDDEPVSPSTFAFARDTDGSKRCGVGTGCWILYPWDGAAGAEQDELLFPAGLVRVVPNVVHLCNSGCKVSKVCAHSTYKGQIAVVARMDKADCKDKIFAEPYKVNCAKAERVVHNCANAEGNRFLLSAFDMDKAGFVKR